MRLFLVLLCVALPMTICGAQAKDAKRRCGLVPLQGSAIEADEREDDQDRARDALNRHEIRPLPEILAAAAKVIPGEVVEVKLECKNRAWQYELRIVTPDRRRQDIYVNAKTLEVTRDD